LYKCVLIPHNQGEFLLVEYDDGFNVAHRRWLQEEEGQLFCKWPNLYQEDHEKAVKKGKVDTSWSDKLVVGNVAELGKII